MTSVTASVESVRLGPEACRRRLERLRPQIAASSWRWRLLQGRARMTGYYPRRLHKALFKSGPLRRPFFIGTYTDGTRFLGDYRDEYSFWRTFDPQSDVPYTEFALHNLGDDAYIDVGANLGVASAVIARRGQGAVYAFEPDPETVDRAAATFALNSLQNATLFRCAVGAYDGELRFHRAPGYSDIASATRPDVDPDHISWVETKVTCFRLDTLFPAEQTARIGFLKIDTEGHDLQVLLGGQGLIARDKPRLLFEYNYHVAPLLGWTIEDAISLIQTLAPYRFHLLGEDGTLADLPSDLTKINIENGYVNVFGHLK